MSTGHPFSDIDPDPYEVYEEQFNPQRTDRRARKGRRPRVAPPLLAEREARLDEVADDAHFEAGRVAMTYRPARHEGVWLIDSLRPFYDQQILRDVLAVVKGGKEASVYRCAADPSTGQALLAAKVYRPRRFRSLSNDALYRQGRDILVVEGETFTEKDDRVMRALGKKSAFGLQVAHTSWLMHEFTALSRLHAAGAAVPHPYAVGENAIVMTYLGDDSQPAPLLSEVRLERAEAVRLFDEALRNVWLLLDHGLIHGDLSAYNILYWEGRITLIDFPQVVPVDRNTQAHFILERDITRLCEYFQRQGVDCRPARLVRELWDRYGAAQRARLEDLSVDEEGQPRG